MRQEDFYTGEPINQGSPPNFSNDELEAAQNASFGQYYYSADSRFMNPPIYNQYQQYNNYQYPNQQYVQQQPNYGLGSPYRYDAFGNPIYNYGYQQQYYQQPQYYQMYQQQVQQPTTYHIDGWNITGSEYLYPSDIEEQIYQLQKKLVDSYLDNEARREVDNISNPYYFGGMNYNYYGVPFYNQYQNNGIIMEYNQALQKIQEEARENNIQLNMSLLRWAWKNSGMGEPDEKKIEEICRGRDVQIEQTFIDCGYTQKEYIDQIRFSNLVPFDNSQMYRDAYDSLDREIRQYIPADGNASNCYDKLGILLSKWELEDEEHKRRNGSAHYNGDIYVYFIKRSKMERYAKEKGIILDASSKEAQVTNFANNFDANDIRKKALEQLPTLNESATIAEDGTLHITCNFGSHAGETYSVHNSQEAEYDEKRERFGRFIDSIPGVIYQNNHEGGNG